MQLYVQVKTRKLTRARAEILQVETSEHRDATGSNGPEPRLFEGGTLVIHQRFFEAKVEPQVQLAPEG